MVGFTMFGTGDIIKHGTENPKNPLYKYLDLTFDLLNDVQFMNKDFREFFKSIQLEYIYKTFIYCDGPYINSTDNLKI